jgi:hypothetical protein
MTRLICDRTLSFSSGEEVRKYQLVHRKDQGSDISSELNLVRAAAADLGERLAEDDLVSLLDKVSYGKCISLGITRSETLVCLLSALLHLHA